MSLNIAPYYKPCCWCRWHA